VIKKMKVAVFLPHRVVDFWFITNCWRLQVPAVISEQNAWTSLSHVPCPFPSFHLSAVHRNHGTGHYWSWNL